MLKKLGTLPDLEQHSALECQQIVMDDHERHLLVEKIAEFLLEIGISARMAPIDQPTFMPGLRVETGVLLIDEARLLYPGDALHEAGHMAVIPAEKRRLITGDFGNHPGEEMAAIAWSYAALMHLGLEPSVVFHEHGYSGGSDTIMQAFARGANLGQPLLEYWHMTAVGQRAKELSVDPFPHMIKWLRD